MMASSRIPGFGLGVAACLAAMLALAGCGGSSNTRTPDPATKQLVTAADTDLQAAKMAVDALTDDSGDTAVTDAERKVAAARTAVMKVSAAERAALDKRLKGLDDSLADKKTSRAAATALKVLDAAKAAVDLVTDDSGAATVTDADQKVRDAGAAVAAASGADNHADLKERLGVLKGKLEDRKSDRTAAMAAKKKADDEMMMKTAGKLYAGIAHRTGGRTSEFVGRRNAVFASLLLRVQIEKVVKELKHDKGTTVAPIKGWTGHKYALTDAGDTYEAYVYGDMAEGTLQTLEDVHPSDYDDATGILAQGSLFSYGRRIARTGFGFDRVGGYKVYEPDAGGTKVTIKGTYYGIPGTFTCTPKASGDRCAARTYYINGQEGVELLGQQGVAPHNYANTYVDWTFKADDPKAKVTQPDEVGWSMYGWWLKTSGNDGALTASAFYGERNGESASVDSANPDLVRGKATYEGGAAGLYALTSHVAGTNDAGQFVADAMFAADFDTRKITGTISNFKTGALRASPDSPRDWSVELMSTDIKSSTGNNIGNWTGDESVNKTRWAIGGTAADASGNWVGSFTQPDGGAGGSLLPKVITGNFYSEYGGSGKIVGGFGGNLRTE